MTILDIIQKKKTGIPLTPREIQFFIDGYVRGSIEDYQASALMMAIWFQGMNSEETVALTLAMRDSGDIVDLKAIPGIKVDKHSTGGVADTTTLVAAPLVAACGGKVAKMSGHGLGHTGGTLDKLESIPGVSVHISMKKFFKQVNEYGISVIGQTGDLVPADKKLYALRDVTATVDNISLIAASIMSKKLASGSDAIVLDVKTGSGAFMKSLQDAEALAKTMVDIGNSAGKKTIALVTDMNQPLGNAVGNILEVIEAIEILKGNEDGDLKRISIAIASEMLIVSGIARNNEEAESKIHQAIENGSGLKALQSMIQAQGGKPECVHNFELLPKALEEYDIISDRDGYIQSFDTEKIGLAALSLGAGRLKKSDKIDPAVGFWLKKRLGEKVTKGDVLARVYSGKKSDDEQCRERFMKGITIGSNAPDKPKLIYEKFE